jgi:hypothetical protein
MTDSNPFFDHPILNSPYSCPRRHWELDDQGKSTQKIIERRRPAEFITPIPKPKKRKGQQSSLVFDEGLGLSTAKQQYNLTAMINAVRHQVDKWRLMPNSADWRVTPETAYLTGSANAGYADVTTNRKSPFVSMAAPLPILGSDPNGCLTLSKARAHCGIRSTSKNAWNKIIRYLRSWL